MSSQFPTVSLRNILLADAATCAATGLAMSTLARPLAALLALPAALLLYAGLALLPIGALMAIVGTRAVPSAPWVRLIIFGNVAWVVASAGLLASDSIGPNAWGVAFIAVQALVVVALTALEIKAFGAGGGAAFRGAALRA